MTSSQFRPFCALVLSFLLAGSAVASEGYCLMITPDDFGPSTETITFETGTTHLSPLPGVTFLATPAGPQWFGGQASFVSTFFGGQAMVNTMNSTYCDLGLAFDESVGRVGAYVGTVNGYTGVWPSEIALAAYDPEGGLICEIPVIVNQPWESPVFVGLESTVPVSRVEWLGGNGGWFGIDNVMYEVPEPGSLLLLSAGALAALRRRR